MLEEQDVSLVALDGLVRRISEETEAEWARGRREKMVINCLANVAICRNLLGRAEHP